MDGPTTGPARKWEERRKLLASRTPAVRIDRTVVRTGKGGTYDVIIEGFGLRPAFSPPDITVGDVPLEQATFANDGRTITGVLRDRPKSRHVAVDLGYAVAEGDAAVE